MLYVYEGASPWQMTLVLDHFRAFSVPSALGSGTKHPLDENPVGALDFGGFPLTP